MKKIILSLTVAALFALASCQKDDDRVNAPRQSGASVNQEMIESPQSGRQDSLPKEKTPSYMSEYMVNPKFGVPNSTYYYFKVFDLCGAFDIAVKLYERSTGTITYLPMTRIGANWILSTRIANNGWYDWRYVYKSNKTNISSNAYVLCNTRNSFSSSSTGTNSITWPFGADGSSWNNRTSYIGGSPQTWRGGEETKGTSYHFGYGNDEGTHKGTNEIYSDDWNRGTGTQDNNAEIRSPLDGYIETISSYSVSGYGNSKFVSIIQEGSNGKLYRFYVAHLNATDGSLYPGKYVRAGITKIGRLGSTGASSPHAHTNLRNITNGSPISVKFMFNAN